MFRKARAQLLICNLVLLLAAAIPTVAQEGQECNVGVVGSEVRSTSTPGGGGTMESQGLTGVRTPWMIAKAAPTTAGTAVSNIAITYYHCKACRDKAKKAEEDAKKKPKGGKDPGGAKEEPKAGGKPPEGPPVYTFDPRTHELKDGKVVPKNPKAEDPHQHCPRPEKFECGQHYMWWLKNHEHRTAPKSFFDPPEPQDYRYDGLDRKVRKIGAAENRSDLRIVMTGTVVAGQDATVSVIDRSGTLIAGVVLDLPDGQKSTTDGKGQATFSVPYGKEAITLAIAGTLVKQAAWAWNGSLDGPRLPQAYRPQFNVPKPVLPGTQTAITTSAMERTPEILIDGQPTTVLASSPTSCLMDVPANLEPGPHSLTMVHKGELVEIQEFNAVRLEVEPPKTLIKGQTSEFSIRVIGTEDPVSIEVRNDSPNVLKLMDRSSVGVFKSTGGSINTVRVRIRTVNAGAIVMPVSLISG